MLPNQIDIPTLYKVSCALRDEFDPPSYRGKRKPSIIKDTSSSARPPEPKLVLIMASTDNDVGSTGSRRGTSSQEPDETTCVAMKTTGDQGRCTNTKQTATKAFLRAGKSFDGPDVLKNMCAQHAKMYQRSPADVKFCREYSVSILSSAPLSLCADQNF